MVGGGDEYTVERATELMGDEMRVGEMSERGFISNFLLPIHI